MNNKESKNTNIKNTDSTPIDLEDYKSEIKENAFFKIFQNFHKKALPSGNQKPVHTTNISINSMMLLGNFKSKLFKALETIQKIFVSNKNSSKNSISPQIINEEETQMNNQNLDSTIGQITKYNITSNIIIPYPIKSSKQKCPTVEVVELTPSKINDSTIKIDKNIKNKNK